MSKYYIYSDVMQQPSTNTRIGATVVGVSEDRVHLLLDNGAKVVGYGGKIYNEKDEEIPLETVRRDFLPMDTASLMARIAQLEAMVTGGGTNV